LRKQRKIQAREASNAKEAKEKWEAYRKVLLGAAITRQKQGLKDEVDKLSRHFEKLFSKKSEQELLGLKEELVGRKDEPKEHLGGPPTIGEVKEAIKKLQNGKAPGEDGLRLELFKVGGTTLAERLVANFEQLWPKVGQYGKIGKVEIEKSWSDATVIPLYKGKGRRKIRGTIEESSC
jgi:hypothetical protein